MRIAPFVVLVLSLFTFVLPSVGLAYEASMPNLIAPSTLKWGQMEFAIHHRFLGRIDNIPGDTFFGIQEGANIGLGLRLPMKLTGLEVKGGWLRSRSEYTLGVSYGRQIGKAPVSAQADLQFADYEIDGTTSRKCNFFYVISLQTKPIWGRLQPCFDVGYDYLNRHTGIGAGLAFRVNGRITLYGEYFPSMENGSRKHLDWRGEGPEDFFDFGVRIETYGHHFFLMLSDGNVVGTKYLMLGPTPFVNRTEYLYFGFNIERLLQF